MKEDFKLCSILSDDESVDVLIINYQDAWSPTTFEKPLIDIY